MATENNSIDGPADGGASAPSSISQRLARNLFERRRALQLTQAQVAERLGVDVETLSRFERGKHLPSLATLERLASVLKATVADLLSEVPVASSDEAETLALWLADLAPDDRAFARAVLKQCCDHLARKTMRRAPPPLRSGAAVASDAPSSSGAERASSGRRRLHRSDGGAEGGGNGSGDSNAGSGD